MSKLTTINNRAITIPIPEVNVLLPMVMLLKLYPYNCNVLCNGMMVLLWTAMLTSMI